MRKITIILDLDGVLITTPTWKADEIDSDGYSKFNEACVSNLNELLSEVEFDLVLSSSRRTVKTLSEFNRIFKRRGIRQEINCFVPIYEGVKARKEEVEKFLDQSKLKHFLILDDDKSLNGLADKNKKNLVLTDLLKGFDQEKLRDAKTIVKMNG